MSPLIRPPLWIGQVIFLFALGALWQALAIYGFINPILIGDPVGILLFLYNGLFTNCTLVPHLLWTLWATVSAFLIGSILGIGVGSLFVAYPGLEKFLEPIFAGLNALPRVALAPLFLLWFGLGISSKVALGASLTFFIVLSGTVAGARSVDSDHLTLSRMLGATSTQIFTQITLPGAVPTLFSSLRLGLIYALLGVVAGELLAARAGLGQALSLFAGSFQTNGVFAVLFLLALIGSCILAVMNRVEARFLRWK